MEQQATVHQRQVDMHTAVKTVYDYMTAMSTTISSQNTCIQQLDQETSDAQ